MRVLKLFTSMFNQNIYQANSELTDRPTDWRVERLARQLTIHLYIHDFLNIHMNEQVGLIHSIDMNCKL